MSEMRPQARQQPLKSAKTYSILKHDFKLHDGWVTQTPHPSIQCGVLIDGISFGCTCCSAYDVFTNDESAAPQASIGGRVLCDRGAWVMLGYVNLTARVEYERHSPTQTV
jgi:hypothetical protein